MRLRVKLATPIDSQTHCAHCEFCGQCERREGRRNSGVLRVVDVFYPGVEHYYPVWLPRPWLHALRQKIWSRWVNFSLSLLSHFLSPQSPSPSTSPSSMPSFPHPPTLSFLSPSSPLHFLIPFLPPPPPTSLISLSSYPILSVSLLIPSLSHQYPTSIHLPPSSPPTSFIPLFILCISHPHSSSHASAPSSSLSIHFIMLSIVVWLYCPSML